MGIEVVDYDEEWPLHADAARATYHLHVVPATTLATVREA